MSRDDFNRILKARICRQASCEPHRAGDDFNRILKGFSMQYGMGEDFYFFDDFNRILKVMPTAQTPPHMVVRDRMISIEY